MHAARFDSTTVWLPVLHLRNAVSFQYLAQTNLIRGTMSKLNVYQRIHAVMNEIGTIEKRGRNDFHKYDYATEADYVHALRPLLQKHGLVVIPRILSSELGAADEKGNILTSIRVKFTLVNIDNPSEIAECVVIGQGQDKGDKGSYKAMTGAKKYWAALTFMVATGDDPENNDGSESSTRRQVDKKIKSKPASSDDF
jgi:hypothetical protein